MSKQLFYHSFPRCGRNTAEEIEKGYAILTAIRDIGLALVPEYIEWKQPTTGEDRIFPRTQSRVCFTMLNEDELQNHAYNFGHFALEFDEITIREMGGVPVFYIPQPHPQSSGTHIGTLLLSIASDAQVLVNRIKEVKQILDDSRCADRIDVTTRFSQSPGTSKTFNLNRKEALNMINMLGNAITPWDQLDNGMNYLLNMFYPADDKLNNIPLDYYKQREWRIAGNWALNGVDLLRSLTSDEAKVVADIDKTFFTRPIKLSFDEARMIDKTLVLSRFRNKPFLQSCRRVIVPVGTKARALDLLASVAPSVTVLDTSEL